MRYFRVKNEYGEQYVSVPDSVPIEDSGVDLANADEIDRMPTSGFERWAGPKTGWVSDDEAKAKEVEDGRLRLLSPSERQQEYVEASVAAMAQRPVNGTPGAL